MGFLQKRLKIMIKMYRVFSEGTAVSSVVLVFVALSNHGLRGVLVFEQLSDEIQPAFVSSRTRGFLD